MKYVSMTQAVGTMLVIGYTNMDCRYQKTELWIFSPHALQKKKKKAGGSLGLGR